MAVKFNPFSGQLQIDEKGASASYIDGEVATYNDLPLSSTTAPLNSAWLVRSASGVWPVSRKQAGIYIRTATGGSSRDADWTYAGTMPDVFSDANFTIYDDADTSKNLKFQLSGISTGITRTLTVPDDSGTISLNGHVHSSLYDEANAVTGLSVNDYNVTAWNGNLAFDALTASRNYIFPDESGTIALLSNITKTAVGLGNVPNVDTTNAANISSGILPNARVNWAAPSSIGSTTAASGAFTTLSANNGTLTASAPVLDLAQTWNNAAATFTGLRFNVTNTASGGSSLLADFQVGGTTQFSISRTGTMVSAVTDTGIVLTSRVNFVSYDIRGGGGYSANGLRIHGTGTGTQSMPFWAMSGGYNFNTSASSSSGSGFFVFAEADNVAALRNGTNAQTFRLYNTFTDASNYERGFIGWSSNTLRIGTEKAGTGSARALEFQTDGAMRGGFASDGGFYLNNSSYSTGTSFHFQPVANRGGMWVYEASFELASSSATMRGGPNATDWIRMSLGRLMFSGTTSSFPALKRSSTTLQVRLADDSAYSVLDAQLRAQGTAPATSGAAGTAGDIRYDADYIYICTAANTWKRASIATW